MQCTCPVLFLEQLQRSTRQDLEQSTPAAAQVGPLGLASQLQASHPWIGFFIDASMFSNFLNLFASSSLFFANNYT